MGALQPPVGLEGIVRAFGDPGLYLMPDGGVSPRWQEHRFVQLPLPAPLVLSWDPTPEDPAPRVLRTLCHVAVRDALNEALLAVHGAGLWDALNTYGGCYAWRAQKGGRKLSTHAWAIAVDVDVDRNPLGAEPLIDPRVVAIFEGRGWTWGGRWARPDGMHFQYASGY